MMYQFRSDCMWDVTELLRNTGILLDRIEIQPHKEGREVTVKVWTDRMSLEDMQDCLHCVQEGDTMWETVELVQDK